MEADLQFFLVDVNEKITVIVIVVLLQQQLLHLRDGIFAFKVAHVSAAMRLSPEDSMLRPDQNVDVMTAVAANDEGDVDLLAAEFDDPRVSLVWAWPERNAWGYTPSS